MRHYILLMLTLLVSQPLCAQVDTTISAPGPTSSRNDGGASRVPPDLRHEHTTSGLPLSHSTDFEDFCGPAGIYGCNFMKPDAESRWLMDAKIAASTELDVKNQIEVAIGFFGSAARFRNLRRSMIKARSCLIPQPTLAPTSDYDLSSHPITLIMTS